MSPTAYIFRFYGLIYKRIVFRVAPMAYSKILKKVKKLPISTNLSTLAPILNVFLFFSPKIACGLIVNDPNMASQDFQCIQIKGLRRLIWGKPFYDPP